MNNQYRHRVRYSDPGTGQELFTGLCRDLNDAMLKAAFLGGTVIDDDDGKANDDSYTYSANGKTRINKNGNFGF